MRENHIRNWYIRSDRRDLRANLIGSSQAERINLSSFRRSTLLLDASHNFCESTLLQTLGSTVAGSDDSYSVGVMYR